MKLQTCKVVVHKTLTATQEPYKNVNQNDKV